MPSSSLARLLITILWLVPVSAEADDYVITLKDDQFAPKELVIPANQKVQLTIRNQGTSPAEFESADLNREKIVGPNSDIIVFIGPLDAGSYGYFNDFHRETTGTITVK